MKRNFPWIALLVTVLIISVPAASVNAAPRIDATPTFTVNTPTIDVQPVTSFIAERWGEFRNWVLKIMTPPPPGDRPAKPKGKPSSWGAIKALRSR